MKPDGGPAFPKTGRMGKAAGGEGISVRDFFAAAALQGMLAYSLINASYGNYHENCTSQRAAGAAYDYADAMLAERSK